MCCTNHILYGDTAPSAMEACNGISDFIPNLCVQLDSFGTYLVISFAETVLIELANAFSKLPFRGTGCQVSW
jgi:hypothetical protein